MVRKIVTLFILWRLFLFLPLVTSHFFLPYRKGYEYTLVTYFTKATNPINHFLLSPWGNFDGVYYLLIAAKGYTINAGFFPLFPLIIRGITLPFGTLLPFDPIQYDLALILVSLLFLIALMVFYQLLRFDYSTSVSLKSIIVLLLFPVSFYFASIYTESLFFLLTLLAFYWARRRWWLLAGLAGGLLTGTRIVGIAILPALVWEFYMQEKETSIWKKIRSGFPLLFVPVGLVSYIWFNFVTWKDPFFFVKAQGALANNRSVSAFIFPLQTVVRYLRILFVVPAIQYEWWVALFELMVFFFALAFLFLAWRRGVRFSYLLFAIFCFLLPISTGTFSGLPRYVVVLFPVYIVLALVQSKRLFWGYVVFGGIILFLSLMAFSGGYFIS